MKCVTFGSSTITVNQHFPNDQCMTIQNHVWMKDSFKMQPMDFNVTTDQEMVTDLVSDSTKKLPFVKFWYGIKEEYLQLSKSH